MRHFDLLFFDAFCSQLVSENSCFGFAAYQAHVSRVFLNDAFQGCIVMFGFAVSDNYCVACGVLESAEDLVVVACQ